MALFTGEKLSDPFVQNTSADHAGLQASLTNYIGLPNLRALKVREKRGVYRDRERQGCCDRACKHAFTACLGKHVCLLHQAFPYGAGGSAKCDRYRTPRAGRGVHSLDK